MIESKVDEDLDTDTDQLKIARLQVMVELKEALDLISDNGNNILRNRAFMKIK
jgi:hypothetical protein